MMSETKTHSGIKFRILSILKSIIPIKILFHLRYFRQFFHSYSILLNPNKKRIYYLDAPDYGNLGDQAIALAIRKFSEKEFPEYEFVEILQCEVVSYMKWLKKTIAPHDLIFLTGGGNMGNKYRMYEATRRYVIEKLPKNKVFVFPQSVDFTNDIFGRVSMKASCAHYNLPNVRLFVREKVSLSKVCKAMPKAVLVPDIVLSLSIPEALINSHKNNTLGICLRNDMEGVLNTDDKEAIYAFGRAKASNDVMMLSTASCAPTITENNREEVVFQRLSDFSKCKLIITDRLHAMIFAVVTKTPCVVFDNKNHKISGTFNFIKDNSAVVLINNIGQLDEAVEQVMTMSYDMDLTNMFTVISNMIKENQYGQDSKVF